MPVRVAAEGTTAPSTFRTSRIGIEATRLAQRNAPSREAAVRVTIRPLARFTVSRSGPMYSLLGASATRPYSHLNLFSMKKASVHAPETRNVAPQGRSDQACSRFTR
eukprot:9469412-Pyramimonas_sp.AAC.2